MIPFKYNLRSLMMRRVMSITTALVISLVVMILFILSGFIAGLRVMMLGNAVEGDWIILSRGTTNKKICRGDLRWATGMQLTLNM